MQRKLNWRGLFTQITLYSNCFLYRLGFVASLVILACVALSEIRGQVSPCLNNPPTSLVNHPVPTDCSMFIRCIGTLEILTPCPTGFHFSVARSDCAPIAEAQCTPEQNPEVPPENPGNPDASDICDVNINLQIIASMEDCSKYTICACGHGYTQNCAAGLTFDAAARQCQPTGVCVSSPTLHPDCTNFVGFRPHPSDCHHYFLCAGAAPMLRRCAPGLLFNTLTARCEIGATVTCPAGNPLNSVKPRPQLFSFPQSMWFAKEQPIKYVPMEIAEELSLDIEQ